MCWLIPVLVHCGDYHNLVDIQYPVTSLVVNNRLLKIRTTAIAHVKVHYETETIIKLVHVNYSFALNVLVLFLVICADS